MYDYIKNKYGNNSRLLFTNPNSLLYEIKTKYVYEYSSDNKKMFNLSNYSTQLKYYDNSNKLVVGKIKHERAGFANEEFAGLKPKMYSYLIDDNSKNKKTKDINENVVHFKVKIIE